MTWIRGSVDPDPRYEITDKMNGKAEFKQQKSLFLQETIFFESEHKKVGSE